MCCRRLHCVCVCPRAQLTRAPPQVFYNRAKMMVAHSHDGGQTWARQTLIKNALYFFPTGATVSKLTGVVCASANVRPSIDEFSDPDIL